MLQRGIKKVWISTALAAAFFAALGTTAHAQQGLHAEYHDALDGNAGAVNRQVDATVAFANAGFPTGMLPTNADTFIVRWSGMVMGPTATPAANPVVVTFSLRADDGSRLWVDGQLLINEWHQGGVPAAPGPSQPFTMVPGQKYSIRVDQYENGGNEGAFLDWRYTGQTQISVPTGSLFAECAPPRIAPAVATSTNSILVRMSCDTEGAEIWYTTNNTAPTVGGSTRYTGAFSVAATSQIRAISAKTGMTTSAESTSTVTLTAADVIAPRLVSLLPTGAQQLQLIFSEGVNAVTNANFTLDNGAVVNTATRSPFNATQVFLTCTGLTVDGTFHLAMTGITDQAAPANAMDLNSGTTFKHHVPVTANLQDFYRFDEGTGTTTADSGPGALGGTLKGDNKRPAWVEGVYGSGIYFDGLENNILLSGNLGTVMGNSASLSYWMKSDGRYPGAQYGPNDADGTIGKVLAVCGGANGGGTNDSYWGYMNTTGRVVMGTGDATQLTGVTQVNNDAWHHIVITRDGTSNAVTIYVDGVQDATGIGDAGLNDATFNMIGHVVGCFGAYNYLGSLDEIRFFNAVLTPAEVSELRNAPPSVDAGIDFLAQALSVNLLGTVADDGNPTGSTINWAWTLVSGPVGGTATFNSGATGAGVGAANANVTMSTGGTYVFRLTATESGASGLVCSDDVVVTLSRVTTIWTGPRLITSENQTTATFQVVLTTQPAPATVVNVVLNIVDGTEGLLLTASPLQFTPANWNIPQTVTVQGVDDSIRDLDQPYQVDLSIGVGSDPVFTGTIIQPVLFTNLENDIPGVRILPASGLVTTEDLGTASFQVTLASQPSATVTINFVSSDLTEGTVTPSVSFSTAPGDWSTPRTVTVTGVDDPIIDLDVNYFIVTTVTSGDAEYAAINPVDVQVRNRDNEAQPKEDQVWGCGLTGLESYLGLGLLAFWRRRRRA